MQELHRMILYFEEGVSIFKIKKDRNMEGRKEERKGNHFPSEFFVLHFGCRWLFRTCWTSVVLKVGVILVHTIDCKCHLSGTW